MRVTESIRGAFSRLKPRQRHWTMLIGIFVVTVGTLWAVFSATEAPIKPGANNKPAEASKVTNVGVMAGGSQVKPLDEWVGNAGRKMAQYERDKEEQQKRNKDTEAFQNSVLKRFGTLDEQLRSQLNAAAGQSAPVGPPPAALPPPPPAASPGGAMPPGSPGMAAAEPPKPQLVRIAVAERTKTAAPAAGTPPGTAKAGGEVSMGTVDTYLPVSFTRGIMLGGLDAPTGGQAQSNPHPVLIRLDDNAVLPNRFRSNVRECFVIAAGYGDIASERAYLRTENLSCVRNDGSTLEVKIQGSVYGEDGVVGVRGNLVTKQGQMLANAMLAGLLSGLGQGLSSASTTTSVSTFGTISTTNGSDAFKQGMGNGVGRAFDRLANYYIKLAENTFPVIEVGAGRAVDVVITKGVKIEGGDLAKTPSLPTSSVGPGAGELVRTGGDDEY
ncbi:MAG: TraB/VirB10 family protein [Candidatus Methylophosphatis roskildensis]